METQPELNDRQKAQAKALNEAITNIEAVVVHTEQGTSINELSLVALRNVQHGNHVAAASYIEAHLGSVRGEEKGDPPNVCLQRAAAALRTLPKKGN